MRGSARRGTRSAPSVTGLLKSFGEGFSILSGSGFPTETVVIDDAIAEIL